MKEITRSIPVSTIACAKVVVLNGEFVKEELEPIKIIGREIQNDKADKEVKKFYKNVKNTVTMSVTITYDVYSISLDDFMKYGKKIEPKIDETEQTENN